MANEKSAENYYAARKAEDAAFRPRYHRVLIPPGGTGPSAAYHADAVHFDGTAYLQNDTPTTPESRYAAGSFWVKLTQEQIDAGYDFLGGGSVAIKMYAGNPDKTALQIDLFGDEGTLTLISTTGVFVADTWTNIRFDADLTGEAGHIFKGLVDVTESAVLDGDSTVFPANSLTTLGFPDNAAGAYPAAGDFADYFLKIGQMNMAFAADGASFIDAAGKPKNPNRFPSAHVLFSGNASSFATNQGTGGAFTLTGSLTNASTSPSD